VQPEPSHNQEDAPTRILIVDDEPGVREGCRRVLVAQGYEVDTAEDAARGLALMRDHPYDLVFVDLKMPGMDGLEFLAAARLINTETVFVVITAYATLSMAVDATKRGAYDFVAKPFTPDELLAVTSKALERSALLRERKRLYEERARRLLELTTLRGRFRSVVEAMSDGLLVTNREGQVVLCNATAMELTGCVLAPGQTPHIREAVHPPELVALIEQAASGPGDKRLAKEIRIDGDPPRVITASARPVTDQDGSCLGVVTVLNDVSELKQVEQIMAQFVNMVAHELRAPLAAVDAQIMAIIQGYARDPDQQLTLLERSHLRIQRLLELVSDLLMISRLDTASQIRELGPLNLAQVARDVCAEMQATAQQHQVALTLHAPDDLPTIEADAREMTMILTNLISNAIKYNRPGGSVDVRLRAEFPHLVIEVEDTGVGISAEGQSRIFDEFYRERTPQTERIVGTGLGLSIVRRIVRNYHGTITVQSQLGVGSTFTVRLPVAQSAEA
jgi:PAS domain S-box-containing protein